MCSIKFEEEKITDLSYTKPTSDFAWCEQISD
jgi:hypothetical protein